jgi:hypothetical protein
MKAAIDAKDAVLGVRAGGETFAATRKYAPPSSAFCGGAVSVHLVSTTVSGFCDAAPKVRSLDAAVARAAGWSHKPDPR